MIYLGKGSLAPLNKSKTLDVKAYLRILAQPNSLKDVKQGQSLKKEF